MEKKATAVTPTAEKKSEKNKAARKATTKKEAAKALEQSKPSSVPGCQVGDDRDLLDALHGRAL